MVEQIYALLHEAAQHMDKNAMNAYRQEISRAEQLLDSHAEIPELRGEILLLKIASGDISRENIYDGLMRADDLLRGPSRVFTAENGYAEKRFNLLSPWDHRAEGPVDMERSARNMQKICALLQRLTGFGQNMYEGLCAQLAYYRGDFEAARTLTGDIRFDGRTPDLSQIILLQVMAETAKHILDHKLWKRSYGRLRDIAIGKLPATLPARQQAEVVCAMLDMSIGCLQDVPDWIKSGGFGIIPAPWGFEIVADDITAGTLPLAMMTHVQYLCFSGARIQALQAAELVRKCYGIHNLVLEAYIDLLRAGCYIGLDMPARAQQAIDEAMDRIVPNGLWVIAAEFMPTMGEMIYASARRHDPDAPEKIRSLGEGLLEKLEPLRKEIISGGTEELTQREREIAALVMKGFSNAEIAQQLNVTVRTVKYHLENVYSKLNITRRSKVVSAMEGKAGVKLASWVK